MADLLLLLWERYRTIPAVKTHRMYRPTPSGHHHIIRLFQEPLGLVMARGYGPCLSRPKQSPRRKQSSLLIRDTKAGSIFPGRTFRLELILTHSLSLESEQRRFLGVRDSDPLLNTLRSLQDSLPIRHIQAPRQLTAPRMVHVIVLSRAFSTCRTGRLVGTS